MSTPRDPALSRFQIAHAVAFAVGLTALLIGTFSTRGLWYLVAGPCLTVSGGLILLGYHLTFRGAVGRALRTVLGRPKLAKMNLRAWFWVLAGIWIALLGIDRMRAAHSEPAAQSLRRAESLAANIARGLPAAVS